MFLVLYIIIIILCVTISIIFKRPIDLLIGIMSGFLSTIIVKITTNWKTIKLYCKSKLLLRNKRIRISVSYLFRIKINDKYLLIKSNRDKGKYQPVGGVYKHFKPAFFNRCDIRQHSRYNDEKASDDIRVTAPGVYLLEFIKWFTSQEDREVSLAREFHEELIKSNMIKQSELFPYIMCKFITRRVEPIKYSEVHRMLNMYIADIFEIILAEEQKVAILKSTGLSNRLILADQKTIEEGEIFNNERMSRESRISDSCLWIL